MLTSFLLISSLWGVNHVDGRVRVGSAQVRRRQRPSASKAPTSDNYELSETHMNASRAVREFGAPFGDVIGGCRPAARAPGNKNAHPLPKPPNVRRICSAADVAPRAVTLADTGQARFFEAILQGEIVELRRLVKSMTSRWTAGGTGEHRPPETLTELAARIGELDRLLKALRDRFPHGPCVDGRPAGELAVTRGRTVVARPANGD